MLNRPSLDWERAPEAPAPVRSLRAARARSPRALPLAPGQARGAQLSHGGGARRHRQPRDGVEEAGHGILFGIWYLILRWDLGFAWLDWLDSWNSVPMQSVWVQCPISAQQVRDAARKKEAFMLVKKDNDASLVEFLDGLEAGVLWQDAAADARSF